MQSPLTFVININLIKDFRHLFFVLISMKRNDGKHLDSHIVAVLPAGYA